MPKLSITFDISEDMTCDEIERLVDILQKKKSKLCEDLRVYKKSEKERLILLEELGVAQKKIEELMSTR